jgi:hypothetical protein
MITRWLHFRLDLRGGLLVPEVTVSIAGDPAATFGRPLIEGFANLELRIP